MASSRSSDSLQRSKNKSINDNNNRTSFDMSIRTKRNQTKKPNNKTKANRSASSTGNVVATTARTRRTRDYNIAFSSPSGCVNGPRTYAIGCSCRVLWASGASSSPLMDEPTFIIRAEGR